MSEPLFNRSRYEPHNYYADCERCNWEWALADDTPEHLAANELPECPRCGAVNEVCVYKKDGDGWVEIG